MRHDTTLGAPILQEEYASIQEAFLRLKTYVKEVELDLAPEQFLTVSINVIDRAFKLRDTIQRVFNDANRRHSKAAVGGPRKPRATDLLDLDVTGEAIEQVLKALKGVQK